MHKAIMMNMNASMIVDRFTNWDEVLRPNTSPTISVTKNRIGMKNTPTDARTVPKVVIFEKLKTIAKAEKIEATEEGLEMIAAAGEGSLRDAESLFDQITSFGEKITGEAVERIIGKVGLSKIDAFAELLFAQDTDKALKALYELHEKGHNLVQFNKDLIHYLRRIITLLASPAIESEYQKELTTDELQRIKKHAAHAHPGMGEKEYLDILKRLLQAYQDMRYSPFAVIPFEVAVIEATQKPK